jgi:hypothetical protein
MSSQGLKTSHHMSPGGRCAKSLPIFRLGFVFTLFMHFLIEIPFLRERFSTARSLPSRKPDCRFQSNCFENLRCVANRLALRFGSSQRTFHDHGMLPAAFLMSSFLFSVQTASDKTVARYRCQAVQKVLFDEVRQCSWIGKKCNCAHHSVHNLAGRS